MSFTWEIVNLSVQIFIASIIWLHYRTTDSLPSEKYSTFWPRFFAGFIDGLIFCPIGWMYSTAFSYTAPVAFQIIVCLINAGAFLVYSIWMHARYGQTLGKMVCKVIVLDVSERPLNLIKAIRRDIFGLIFLPFVVASDIPRILHGIDVFARPHLSNFDWIIEYSSLGLFLLEVLTMLTNQKRRALHDFVAGSVVTRMSDHRVLTNRLPA